MIQPYKCRCCEKIYFYNLTGYGLLFTFYLYTYPLLVNHIKKRTRSTDTWNDLKLFDSMVKPENDELTVHDLLFTFYVICTMPVFLGLCNLQLVLSTLSVRLLIGCFSFLIALASICLTRSLVIERCLPTSSRVWSRSKPIPNLIRITSSSLGVKV